MSILSEFRSLGGAGGGEGRELTDMLQRFARMLAARFRVDLADAEDAATAFVMRQIEIRADAVQLRAFFAASLRQKVLAVLRTWVRTGLLGDDVLGAERGAVSDDRLLRAFRELDGEPKNARDVLQEIRSLAVDLEASVPGKAARVAAQARTALPQPCGDREASRVLEAAIYATLLNQIEIRTDEERLRAYVYRSMVNWLTQRVRDRRGEEEGGDDGAKPRPKPKLASSRYELVDVMRAFEEIDRLALAIAAERGPDDRFLADYEELRDVVVGRRSFGAILAERAAATGGNQASPTVRSWAEQRYRRVRTALLAEIEWTTKHTDRHRLELLTQALAFLSLSGGGSGSPQAKSGAELADV